MKQHITLAQVNTLSDKQFDILTDWWIAQEGDIFVNVLGEQYVVNEETHGYMIGKKFKSGRPLLSIGQMIEFLEDQRVPELVIKQIYPDGYEIYHSKGFKDHTYTGNLCDALWESVKQVLEGE